MNKAIQSAIVNAVKEYNGDTVIMSGDAYKTLMLQCSNLYEGARKEARDLRAENQKLKSLTAIMSGYIEDSLEMFEAMFESDEGSFPYDRMADYVTAARFMEAYTGRKHIADRVSDRMKELPF